MKTSNLFLILIAVLVLTAMLISNLALKSAYEKGDYKDRFYGYKTMPAGQVKNVLINLPVYNAMTIEKSDSSMIKYPPGWEQYKDIVVSGDTLKISFKEEGANTYRDTLYILLPDVQFVHMKNKGRLNMTGLQQEHLKVELKNEAHVRLMNTTLDSLEIAGQSSSSVFVEKQNNIRFLDLLLEDQAKFTADDTAFPGLKTRIAGSARVELSGKSLDSFTQSQSGKKIEL